MRAGKLHRATSHPVGEGKGSEQDQAFLAGISEAKGGDSGLVVRGPPPSHHREGRRGSIQVDGEELVSGQSPGPNVPMHREPGFSVSAKKFIGILIGIVLSLWTLLGNTGILTKPLLFIHFLVFVVAVWCFE